MVGPVDRVASAAQEVQLLKVLLTALAFPFYVLGLLAGLVAVVAMWMIAAAQVGFADASRRDAGEDG